MLANAVAGAPGSTDTSLACLGGVFSKGGFHCRVQLCLKEQSSQYTKLFASAHISLRDVLCFYCPCQVHMLVFPPLLPLQEPNCYLFGFSVLRHHLHSLPPSQPQHLDPILSCCQAILLNIRRAFPPRLGTHLRSWGPFLQHARTANSLARLVHSPSTSSLLFLSPSPQ